MARTGRPKKPANERTVTRNVTLRQDEWDAIQRKYPDLPPHRALMEIMHHAIVTQDHATNTQAQQPQYAQDKITIVSIRGDIEEYDKDKSQKMIDALRIQVKEMFRITREAMDTNNKRQAKYLYQNAILLEELLHGLDKYNGFSESLPDLED